MKLWSDSFKDGSAMPGEFAFGVADPVNHVALSTNRNPHLAWSDVPAETRSLALIVHDPDVPSRPDDVNQEGRVVSADLPRITFFHWTLIDLPPSLTHIAAGSFSDGIALRGKPGPDIADAPCDGYPRHGINDFTNWFAQDKDMAGNYFGYDGPCSPWNDELAHRYIFTLYALDVPRLPVEGDFTGAQVLEAMTGHVLAEATLTGWYSLNPAVAAAPAAKV